MPYRVFYPVDNRLSTRFIIRYFYNTVIAEVGTGERSVSFYSFGYPVVVYRVSRRRSIGRTHLVFGMLLLFNRRRLSNKGFEFFFVSTCKSNLRRIARDSRHGGHVT